jgi:hypothetical protein
MPAVWESMKTVFLSGRIADKHRKIAINERERLATAGAESILILLKVPENVVLTLQIEQAGGKNELSWWCNVMATMPRKKLMSERKTTILIRV